MFEPFGLTQTRASIHRRGAKSFPPLRPDASGFQRSAIFAHTYRLTRRKDELGEWEYRLEER